MKKIMSALIIGWGVLYFSGCDEETKEKILPTKMSATVNDTLWKANGRDTYKYETLNQFYITGTSLQREIMNITIFGTQEGEYILNTDILDTTQSADVKFAAVFKRSASAGTDDIYYAKQGKVKITDINTSDQQISGNFHFNMFRASDSTFLVQDTVTVKNGTFENLKYRIKESK
ncbi:MAG: DUF6252 family protein [Bacteroidota bacterium]